MSNPAQVSKVVHEALRALRSTQGDTSTKSYEELSDHDRTTIGQETGTVSSGVKGNVDVDKTVEGVAPDKKLEAYIQHGIVQAFDKYEKSAAGSNTLDATTNRDQATHVDKETVDANNARIRAQQGDKPAGTAANIHEAMQKADGDLAEHNAQGEKTEE